MKQSHLAALRTAVAASLLGWNAVTVADQSLTLAFTPDPANAQAAATPPQCKAIVGATRGTLEPPRAGGTCHKGKLGVAVLDEIVAPAEFTTPVLARPLTLTGPASISIHVTPPGWPSAVGAVRKTLEYQLHEVPSGGEEILIAIGTAIDGIGDMGRWDGAFDVGPYTVASGNRLRLRLGVNASTTSRSDLLFGGEYGYAGVTFAVGASDGGLEGEPPDAGPGVTASGGNSDSGGIGGGEPGFVSSGSGSGSGSSSAGTTYSGGGTTGVALLVPLLIGAIRRHKRPHRGDPFVLGDPFARVAEQVHEHFQGSPAQATHVPPAIGDAGRPAPEITFPHDFAGDSAPTASPPLRNLGRTAFPGISLQIPKEFAHDRS